jgi:hypothetical protein
MKHIFTTYTTLLIGVYFGYQAPRAATLNGTVLLYAIAAAFLTACMIFAVKYETSQRRIDQAKRRRFLRYDANDQSTHPTQDGVYVVRWKDGDTEHTAVTYWTEGTFLKLKRIKVIGWRGPYSNPEEACA